VLLELSRIFANKSIYVCDAILFWNSNASENLPILFWNSNASENLPIPLKLVLS